MGGCWGQEPHCLLGTDGPEGEGALVEVVVVPPPATPALRPQRRYLPVTLVLPHLYHQLYRHQPHRRPLTQRQHLPLYHPAVTGQQLPALPSDQEP